MKNITKLIMLTFLMSITAAPLYCGKGKKEKDLKQPKKSTGSVRGVQKPYLPLSAVAKTLQKNPHAFDAFFGMKENDAAQTQPRTTVRQTSACSDSEFASVASAPLTQLQKLEQEQLFLQRRVNNWGRDYEPDTTAADMTKLREVEEQIAQMKRK